MLTIGGLALLAGMWWVYFSADAVEDLRSFRSALTWGYGHYVLFAAAAAVSSGIEMQVAVIGGEHDHVSALAARMAVGAPVALYVLVTSALVLRFRLRAGRSIVSAVATAAVLVLVSVLPIAPARATLVDAAVLAVFVSFLVVADDQSQDAIGSRA